jgi:hypothetical protein
MSKARSKTISKQSFKELVSHEKHTRTHILAIIWPLTGALTSVYGLGCLLAAQKKKGSALLKKEPSPLQ